MKRGARGLAWRIALLLTAAAPAPGILVDTSDLELYERPPPDDPGWHNVGRRGGTSAIYLGGGWVITARHSSVGGVEFDGIVHEPVPGSMRWLDSPLGGIKADLVMFRIAPEPDLPALKLRRRPIEDGAEVVLIGWGQGRGAPARSGPGFRVDGRWARRWGTNRVESGRSNVRGPNQTLSWCFSTRFDRGGSAHEAQATAGDSGGAVFQRARSGWRLVGVMLSVGGAHSQAAGDALFGNTTQAADLGAYAAQILAVLGDGSAQPETD